MGTNFSTVIGKNGVVLCCRDPLDQSSPWVGKDPESGEEVSIESEVVQDDMGRIGAELAMLQMSKSLCHTTRSIFCKRQPIRGTDRLKNYVKR